MAELPHREDFCLEQLAKSWMCNDVVVNSLHHHGRTVADRVGKKDLGVTSSSERPDEPVLPQRRLAQHPQTSVRRAARPRNVCKGRFFFGVKQT